MKWSLTCRSNKRERSELSRLRTYCSHALHSRLGPRRQSAPWNWQVHCLALTKHSETQHKSSLPPLALDKQLHNVLTMRVEKPGNQSNQSIETRLQTLETQIAQRAEFPLHPADRSAPACPATWWQFHQFWHVWFGLWFGLSIVWQNQRGHWTDKYQQIFIWCTNCEHQSHRKVPLGRRSLCSATAANWEAIAWLSCGLSKMEKVLKKQKTVFPISKTPRVLISEGRLRLVRCIIEIQQKVPGTKLCLAYHSGLAGFKSLNMLRHVWSSHWWQ